MQTLTRAGKSTKQLHWFGAVGQLCKRVWWGDLRSQLEGGYFDATEGECFSSGSSSSSLPDSFSASSSPFPLRSSGSSSGARVYHTFESARCADLKVVWEARRRKHLGHLVVSFAVCLAGDAFNPWKNSNYSIYFLALKILNYRPKPGSQRENLIIVAIVSGPRAPAQYKWYVRMLTDELRVLKQGVQIRKPDGSSAWVYADLKIVAADHPGFAELLNCQHCGASRACKLCDLEGTRHTGQRQFSYLSARRYLTFEGDDAAIRQDPAFGPEETRGPPTRTKNWQGH